MADAIATSLPPGPRLPTYLQTLLLVWRPEPTLRRWRRRHGDLISVRAYGSGRLVIVCDPKAIREVFRGPASVLRAGEANAILEPVLGEHSVLLLDGEEHLAQRRLLLPAFHGERMRSYESIVREATDRAVDGWPVGRPFALLAEMQAVTLEVIVRAVFGVERRAHGDELAMRIRTMLEPMQSRLRIAIMALTGGLLGSQAGARAFQDRVAAVDELLFAEIARRRHATDLEAREDILSMLLLARREDGSTMSDVEIRDELMTMLVAGHETTATALAWTFERLLRTPGVRRVLERELDEGDEYLDATLREALRIRPVVPSVARVLAEPFAVGGYVLPAGVTVVPSVALTHKRADDYPQPNAFRPERFLGGGPDTYTWIPFGGGPRRCLGASFALFEMRVVTRRILERTRLEPVGRAERVVRRAVVLAPARGSRVIQRRPPAASSRGRRARRRRPATPAAR